MFESIVDILTEYVDVPRESITAASSFTNDLGLNSFCFVAMIDDIENAMGIHIPERDLLDIVTIDDLMKYIEKLNKPV